MDLTANQKVYANVQRGVVCFGRLGGARGDRVCNLRVRGPVSRFTESSRKRLKRYLRNSKATYRVFGTLTYPPGFGDSGRSCKRDFEAFSRRLRRILPPGASVCWFIEWQANGRLHYHFLSTHYINRRWLASCWYQIVGSNNPDHLTAGTQIDHLRAGHGKRRQLIAYAVKYAAKLDQKQVPIGFELPGRFWGVIGLRATVDATITMKVWNYEDPEIYCEMEKLKNVRDVAKARGQIELIFIRVGDLEVPIWIFDPDNESLFEALMFHVTNATTTEGDDMKFETQRQMTEMVIDLENAFRDDDIEQCLALVGRLAGAWSVTNVEFPENASFNEWIQQRCIEYHERIHHRLGHPSIFSREQI